MKPVRSRGPAQTWNGRTFSGISSSELRLEALRWPGFDNSDPYNREAFTIAWALMRPERRGRLALTSRDRLEAPRIDGGYLTAPGDMRMIIDAFRQVRVVGAQPALEEFTPGPDVRSDEQIAEYIRATISSGKHPWVRARAATRRRWSTSSCAFTA